MLRNDLIVLLAQGDSDPVTVDVNGNRLDVAAVKVDQAGIVIILHADGLSTEPRDDPTHRPGPRDLRAS